jgi:uncharacterized LabA/DUF88 family protein
MSAFSRTKTRFPRKSLLYLYVDGENHFIRARETWKAIYPYAELDSVGLPPTVEKFAHLPSCDPGLPRIRIQTQAKYFWDAELLNRLLSSENLFFQTPRRAVYFTSFTGKPEELHDARVFIRQGGFEPQVIEEPAQLQKQRENVAAQTGTRKSAKGVDIGLAVRILEDASRNNFDYCILLTTDLDFLPVIDAVRRMGKHVTVMGYKGGMGAKSEFEYVPDRFVDIGESWMKRAYVPITSKIRAPTTRKVGRFDVDTSSKNVMLKLAKEQQGWLNRIKELTGAVASELSTLPSDPLIQADGIVLDAGKTAALQKEAQALEKAIDGFLAVEKEVT